MPAHPNSSVKIVIRDPQIVTPYPSRDVQMLPICPRQDCLVFFGAEKIDGMHSTVLFSEMSKVSLKCWLGGVWTSDLYPLAKCLEALLFPEYYTNVICGRSEGGNIFSLGEEYIHGTLPRTCT